MDHYQAVVIGFGKGGKTLAATLARQGWRVALIEQSAAMYGGTCINIGCIPTKALVHDARQQHGFVQAMQRKNALVRQLNDKNYHMLADLPNLTLINGQAEFIDSHTVLVTEADRQYPLSGEKFFINTGAAPVMPSIPGLSSTPGVYDSTGLLALDTLPARLGILGGGYIGVEFASMFAQFGSQVTVFEAGTQFLPREDHDIAATMADILREQGVTLHLNAQVQQISAQPDGSILVHMAGQSYPVDALLVASGRLPATQALQLHHAGVEINARGAIIVDPFLRTTAEHIWALGDVNGGPQFTYISLDDFRIVKDQLLGEGQRHTGDRQHVPYAVFTTPPLSRVGLTEAQARDAGYAIQVLSLPVAAIPQARVLNAPQGLLKAVIDTQTQHILGVSLLCPEAHELINLIKTVMDAGLPYRVLRDQIFTHPTMSEALNDLFAQANV
ncbi:MAG: reactive chlorine resistance oxidoreductase RclA [Plesiomonas sp.]